jgi:hypothetical protein
MELKKECIGNVMTAKAKNGMTITHTIVNDKRMFKHYKELGFDIFKTSKKSESKEGDNK